MGRVQAAEAQEGQPLLLGQKNVADAGTQLTLDGPGPTIEIGNDNSGPGLLAQGVIGVDPTLANQVQITDTYPAGVAGLTEEQSQLPGVGVLGSTDPTLPAKTPVTQTCAMRGVAVGSRQVGISAENASGIGLKVLGRIAVSCAGTAVIPQGADMVAVKDANIRADSLVLVTLTGPTGSRSSLFSHTEVESGGATFHLTKPTKLATTLNYFCFEHV